MCRIRRPHHGDVGVNHHHRCVPWSCSCWGERAIRYAAWAEATASDDGGAPAGGTTSPDLPYASYKCFCGCNETHTHLATCFALLLLPPHDDCLNYTSLYFRTFIWLPYKHIHEWMFVWYKLVYACQVVSLRHFFLEMVHGWFVSACCQRHPKKKPTSIHQLLTHRTVKIHVDMHIHQCDEADCCDFTDRWI